MKAEAGGVQLEVTIDASPEVVVLVFTTENHGEEAAFFAAYPGDLDKAKVREGEAYVAFDADEAHLLVSLLAPDPPLEANFGQVAEPLFVRIAPGGRHEGRIELPVPVHPWDPYLEVLSAGEDASESERDLADATALRFTTGVVVESDVMQRWPGPAPETWWVAGFGEREFVVEASLDPPVAVVAPSAGDRPEA